MGHAVERVCTADWRRHCDVRGASTVTFGARTLTSYTIAEIAHALRRSPEAVKVTLYRAKERFRIAYTALTALTVLPAP